MNHTLKCFLFAAGAMLLAGCDNVTFAGGPPQDNRQVESTDQIRSQVAGMSKQDVIALLGKPSSVASLSEPGTEMYAWASYGSLPATNVKILNGTGSEVASVSMFFDDTGHEYQFDYN